MEEYNIGLQNPKLPPSPSSLSLMNPSNLDLYNSFPSMEALNTNNNNINGMFMPFPNEGFSDHHQQQQQQQQSDHLPISHFNDSVQRSIGPYGPVFDPLAHFFPSSHGWNNMNMVSSELKIIGSSSPSVSGIALAGANKNNKNQQNHEGKKRKRVGEKSEKEKPREVVHVRAKRGQATDSHSLAERLRREKINEKLRCLQDLVPGCYKTMGMAVMLDVIINYVRSLQNQIDFLSMKLSAASLFYDFNSSEAEAIEAIQQGTAGYEAQGMDKIMGEDYANVQTPWPL